MKINQMMGGLAIAAALAACGGAEPTANPLAPAAPTPNGNAAGSSGLVTPTPTPNNPTMQVGNMTMTPTPTPAAGTIPCEVATVLSDSCSTCHSASPKFSAPMPLMTAADFQAVAKSDATKKVYQIVPGRISATDPTKRMPPTSGTALTAPSVKSLNDWLAGGAAPVANGCAVKEKAATGTVTETPKPNTGMAGTGGTVVPSETGRLGGASDKKQEYNDPNMKCFEFRAHAAGDKTKPYSVSTTPDQYTNFTFMPPWTGMQYARSFRVLPGNDKVIHHWLLYKNNSAGPDGDISPSSGAHPNGELVHGWAPGGSDLYMDSDVGLEMPSTVAFTLETHHNNTSPGALTDNSGIEVCVTSTVPKNVASLSWLGTDAINGTTASGSCKPTSTQPIHIIGGQPHMHLKGRHMSAIITRADGKKETLHDQPFDFQYQHSYNNTTILMPGESIKTTCTYSAPTSFGEGTNDEMCYYFTLYYPKLSLTNGNPIATLIHGPNTCLE